MYSGWFETNDMKFCIGGGVTGDGTRPDDLQALQPCLVSTTSTGTVSSGMTSSGMFLSSGTLLYTSLSVEK